MRGCRRQCVLRTLRFGRAVASPLALVGDHRLASRHIERAISVFDPQDAFQNHCISSKSGVCPGSIQPPGLRM